MKLLSTDNLTHPGADPVNGDVIRYTYDNGFICEKNYLELGHDSTVVERELSIAEFIDLFTDAELVKLVVLSRTDDKAEAFMMRIKYGGSLKLSSSRIATGLTYLVNQGVITGARKNEMIGA